jgi:lysine biosynthesis protein LysW
LLGWRTLLRGKKFFDRIQKIKLTTVLSCERRRRPMALKTVSGTAECPECFAEIELKNVMQNEIVQCPECGVDLEVVSHRAAATGAGSRRRRRLGRIR